MPILMLIDMAYSLNPEIQTHTVSDRDGARRILAYDLQNTANREWSAEILAEFDAGQNVIEKPNGKGHYFRIEYLTRP